MRGLPMVKVEEIYELNRTTLTLWARCSASISLPQGYSTPHAGDNAEITLDNAEITLDNAEITLDNAKITLDNAEITLDNAEITLNGAEITLNGAEDTLNGAENTSLNKRYIRKHINRRKKDSNNLILRTLRESHKLDARETSLQLNLSLNRTRELLPESVELGKIVTYESNVNRNICLPDNPSLRNAWKQCAGDQEPTLPHSILSISVNADSYERPGLERCFLRRKEKWQR